MQSAALTASLEPRRNVVYPRQGMWGATGEVFESRRLGFVPALDGLRAIAVLMVVSVHLGGRFPRAVPSWWPQAGFLGVDVFFVLSGFLITALLLREQASTGRLRFREFYRRRALRLLPALIALMVAQWIFATRIGIPAHVERSTLLAGLFYVLNWKSAYFHPVAQGLGQLWSLAIEEQFYLLWPLVVVLFLGVRRQTATVTWVLTGLIAAVAIDRALLFERGATWGVLYFRTDTHCDGLLVGALLAQLWVRRRTPTRGLQPAAWIAAVFLAVCFAKLEGASRFLYLGGFTAVALAVAVIVLAILESSWSATRVLESAGLQALGRVSYGLYLWHPLVFIAVVHYGSHWGSAVQVAVTLEVTAVATIASRLLVERPFLRLKDRSAASVPEPAATLHDHTVRH